jgi:hypothetical protein
LHRAPESKIDAFELDMAASSHGGEAKTNDITRSTGILEDRRRGRESSERILREPVDVGAPLPFADKRPASPDPARREADDRRFRAAGLGTERLAGSLCQA